MTQTTPHDGRHPGPADRDQPEGGEAMNVRPERSFGTYSRGHELLIAIENCQDANERLSRRLPDLNQRIEANCQRVKEEFDLTWDEWCYWSLQLQAQRESRPGSGRS